MASEFSVSFMIGAALGSGFAGSFKAAQQYLQKTAKSTSELNRQQSDLEAQQKALNQAVSTGIINANSYQQAMTKVAASMQQVKNAQKGMEFQQKFNDAGSKKRSAMASTIEWGAMTYALSEPIQQAMKFQSAMSDVKKVVDMTEDEFKNMSSDIIVMSQRIPMTAEEISKIIASGGQAGIAKSELLEFAESAAKMGVAFDITAEQAGDMMAKWRTAFKMGQSDVVVLSDKINYLGNTTAASADKISDVVTRIGPLGEVGGVASGEIAALGASMVSTGVESEVASTGIKNLILGMTAGEGATNTQAAAFARLGLDATEMSQRMQVDAKGAIIDVLTAIKGMDKATQASTLKDLFGKESIGAIAPLLSNLDALKDNFEKVADATKYTGSMEAEYTERSKTAENAMKLMKNAVNGLSVELGSSLLPMLTEGIERITGFIKIFSDFTSAHPVVAQAIYGVVIGFTAMMTVVSAVKVAVFAGQQAYYAFQMGQVALRGVLLAGSVAMKAMIAAQWLFNAAVSANPLGLFIIAIMGVIAAGVALYTYWDEIKAFMTSLWESPTFAVIAYATGPIGWLIAAGVGLIANWEQVKEWFSLLWENPKAALQQFYDWVMSKLGGLFDWIAGKWDWIKSVFSAPIHVNIQATASGNGQSTSIEENANGGIYKQGAFLTTFAENSPKAAIPLDGSSRALNLYRQTGELLGLNPTSGNTAITASFSPNITIQGNADQNIVSQALRKAQNDFEEMLANLEHTRRRKSYA